MRFRQTNLMYFINLKSISVTTHHQNQIITLTTIQEIRQIHIIICFIQN